MEARNISILAFSSTENGKITKAETFATREEAEAKLKEWYGNFIERLKEEYERYDEVEYNFDTDFAFVKCDCRVETGQVFEIQIPAQAIKQSKAGNCKSKI